LALAVQTDSSQTEAVRAACIRAYAGRRVSVESLDTVELRDYRPTGVRLQGIVARIENRVEVIIPEAADLGEYPAALDGLARAGWDVWVLVPTEKLGSAHRHLRRTAVTLQPWWETAAGIAFGRPEIP